MHSAVVILLCAQCLFASGQLQFVPWTKLSPARSLPGLAVDDESESLADKIFDKSAELAWKLFKMAYGKGLYGVENDFRFQIFKKNYRMILEHNAKFELGLTTYRMDVNEFADKTHSEMKSLRGLRMPPGGLQRRSQYTHDSRTPPDSLDWRQKGAVTQVKNQGNCGSCWAFSTTGAVEGHHFVNHHRLVNLSEQQLVDCSLEDGNNACNGGLMDFAFKYIKEAGGIVTEECYPYVSGSTSEQNPQCMLNKTCIVAHVTGYVDLPKANESALKSAVGLRGPVAVAINAGLPSFSFYSSGIYEDRECGGEESDLDHGVLAVGYGQERGTKYWLVKNSWGPQWGEKGYIRIRRDKHNMCGVATAASYPLV